MSCPAVSAGHAVIAVHPIHSALAIVPVAGLVADTVTMLAMAARKTGLLNLTKGIASG
jgi:hypothetical protein